VHAGDGHVGVIRYTRVGFEKGDERKYLEVIRKVLAE
jgi:hypothetical protein